MYEIRHGLEHVLQELPRRLPVGLLDELGDGKLAGSVDAREEMKLPLGGLNLGDVPFSADCFAIACPAARQGHAKHDPGRGAVDVEEPDRVALEPLSLRFVPLDVRQAGNAMSLQAPVQRRPRQVRDLWLQGVEAIVQRQQGMASKGNDRRFPGLGQNRRARLCRTGLHILDRRALAPLRDRLRVDPKFLAQLRERSPPLSGSCFA